LTNRVQQSGAEGNLSFSTYQGAATISLIRLLKCDENCRGLCRRSQAINFYKIFFNRAGGQGSRG
jgi:hypothetical protein